MMKRLIGLCSLLAVFFMGHIGAEECCEESCCLGTFGAGGEWLYWKTEESRLEYAAQVSGRQSNVTLDLDAKVLRPKFQYDNGFRVYVDYTTCNNLWQFSALLTHMPTSAKNEFSSLGTDFASLSIANFPLLTVVSTVPLNILNSKWCTSVYYFDLDVSRTWTCENVQIIPHLGVRGLWSDQTLRLHGEATPQHLFFDSSLFNKVNGAGLEGGLKAAWQLCRGLSVVGNVGGSVIYAHFNDHGRLTALTPDNSTIDIRFNGNTYRTTTMFDAFIGLEYDTCICQYGVHLLAGWEQHIIYDVEQFSLAGAGNMSMQGFTLGGGVSF